MPGFPGSPPGPFAPSAPGLPLPPLGPALPIKPRFPLAPKAPGDPLLPLGPGEPYNICTIFLRTLLRQESIPKTLKLKEYPNETKKKVIKIHKNFGANKAWGEFSVDDVNKHNSKMVGFEWWHIHKMDVYLQHSEVQYTHTMGQLIPSILYYELCNLHFWKAPSSMDNLSRLT